MTSYTRTPFLFYFVLAFLFLRFAHAQDAQTHLASSINLEDELKSLSESSQVARQLFDHTSALQSHKRMLSIYNSMGNRIKPTKFLMVYTELVTDYKLMRKFSNALEIIMEMKKKMKELNALETYPDMTPFIYRLESNILQCDGQYKDAIVKSHFGLYHLLVKMFKNQTIRVNFSQDDLFELSEYRLLLQRSRLHLREEEEEVGEEEEE